MRESRSIRKTRTKRPDRSKRPLPRRTPPRQGRVARLRSKLTTPTAPTPGPLWAGRPRGRHKFPWPPIATSESHVLRLSALLARSRVVDLLLNEGVTAPVLTFAEVPAMRGMSDEALYELLDLKEIMPDARLRS